MRRLAGLAALLSVTVGCRDYLVDESPDEDGYDPVFRVAGTLEARADVDVPSGPIEIAVMRVDLRGDGTPTLGGPWRSATGRGALTEGAVDFELELPRMPAASELYAPDDEAGTLRIASYLIGAYVDVDGDGAPGPDDVLVGGSMDLLVFADGARAPGSEGLSPGTGWSLVPWRIDGAPEPVIPIGWRGDLDDLALDANLLPVRREDGLDGRVRTPLGAVRVDLYAITEYYTGERPAGATLRSVAVDAMAGDTPFRFDGALDAPPAQHLFQNGDVTGADIAVAVAVAYVDTNGNGSFDPDTDMYYGTSLDAEGEPRMLLYVRPLDFTAALYAQIYGQAAGWVLCDVMPDAERTADWNLGVVVDRED